MQTCAKISFHAEEKIKTKYNALRALIPDHEVHQLTL